MFTSYVRNSQTGWYCSQIWLAFKSGNRNVIAGIAFKNCKDWLAKQFPVTYVFANSKQRFTLFNRRLWNKRGWRCMWATEGVIQQQQQQHKIRGKRTSWPDGRAGGKAGVMQRRGFPAKRDKQDRKRGHKLKFVGTKILSENLLLPSGLEPLRSLTFRPRFCDLTIWDTSATARL